MCNGWLQSPDPKDNRNIYFDTTSCESYKFAGRLLAPPSRVGSDKQLPATRTPNGKGNRQPDLPYTVIAGPRPPNNAADGPKPPRPGHSLGES